MTEIQQYNNRILEAVIAHLQDAGHPIPYSKFSCPKMRRNIANSSFAVEQDRGDYTILLALKTRQWRERTTDKHARVVVLRFYDVTK